MPRYLLFGLVRVPMYEYYYGMTIAQIQILDIDQPLTLYKRHDPNDGKKPGDKGYVYDSKKLHATSEKWKRGKEEREKRGFNLRHLLQTGEMKPIGGEGE